MKKSIIYLFISFIIVSGINCSVYETIVNISRLTFKLGQVNNFKLNGVNISNKSKLSDFTAQEILMISSAVANGKLPVSFTLNVEAKNPNDGTGGYPRTGATIKSFPWRLLIDEKETISGNIGNSIYVPGTGEATNFPLEMNLDLVNFFNSKGYESLINLALNIGGQGGSPSQLTVFAQPVVTTTLGDIRYPDEVKIVDYQFNK